MLQLIWKSESSGLYQLVEVAPGFKKVYATVMKSTYRYVAHVFHRNEKANFQSIDEAMWWCKSTVELDFDGVNPVVLSSPEEGSALRKRVQQRYASNTPHS